jgi:excisionase family DNA binding protein
MALWRVDEAADFLGIRPKTLYEWVRQGRVPYRKIGFNVRFDPAELESWVGSQSRGPEPDDEATTRSAGSLRAPLDRGRATSAPASESGTETQELMGEAAVALRDLEREVGAELSFTRRQQLSALAERLENAVRDLAKMV